MFAGKISDRLKERAAKIKLIGFDVDGVLTDGSIFIGDHGEFIKRFFALDGLGIRLAHKFGIGTAIISARKSNQTLVRFSDLGVEEIHIGIEDKLSCLKAIAERKSLSFDEIAFIGDDSIDVPILEQVGLAACPPNAHYSVLKHIHYITERAGGEGAARELIDLVLFAQGMIPG